MNFKRVIAFLFVFAVFSAGLYGSEAAEFTACEASVQTSSGAVKGRADDDTATCVWKGIPYAAPPLGDLRWRAPREAESWDGVLDAYEYGPACMQKGLMTKVNADDGGMSEDCLYLNIWRPAKSGRFPVMVWIHGGGYTGGTGGSEFYQGDRMSETGDVVIVTINYRLNVFGFFALPVLAEEDEHASVGNYGSLDQSAALKWVHENISGFGGDPDNVTIFGESAGGWSVCTMVATPLNKGLFKRAILESGGCLASASMEKGFERGMNAVSKLGCEPDDLECLRSIDPDKILDKVVGGTLGGFTYVPVHDGYLLTDSPLAMINSGNFNNVDFIAGSNHQEVDALLALAPIIMPGKKKRARKLFGSDYERVLELYPPSEYRKTRHAYGQASSDAGLRCPTYDGALAISRFQPDTYYYRFDFDDMRFGKYIHAVHAMEIPFVFNSLDREPMNLLYPKKKLPEAQKLSRVIQGYWLNFAKTGDPNGPGLPEWKPFGPEDQRMQILDVYTRNEPVPEKFQERCEYWSEYVEKNQPIWESMGNIE